MVAHLRGIDDSSGQIDLGGMFLILIAQTTVPFKTHPAAFDPFGGIFTIGLIFQSGKGIAQLLGGIGAAQFDNLRTQIVTA